MTTAITPALRALVVERAQGQCEYCGLSQAGQEATFHVDHVTPRVAGGPTEESNLALACVGCSLHKAARREGPDPTTGATVTLFSPRTDRWSSHFVFDGVWVRGTSPIGRATVEALAMNWQLLLEARAAQEALRRRTRVDEEPPTPLV